MTLTTGTLRLRTGTPTVNITRETFGDEDWDSGNRGVLANRDEADWVGGGNPSGTTGMREWSGKEQSWGRVFGEFNDQSVDVEVKRAENLGFVNIPMSETELFQANRLELIKLRKDNDSANVLTADDLKLEVFRRTKQTGGSWGSAIQTNDPYNNQNVATDFKTFDYRMLVSDNSPP